MSYLPTLVDPDTDAAVVLDFDHHEVHEGDSYVATYFASAVGSGSNVDLRVTAPNTAVRCHIVPECVGSVEFEALIYEGGNVTVGTDLDKTNRDRNSANTATLEVAHTPTVTTTGTLIWSQRFGSGVQRGGESRGLNEIILDQGTTYLFRVTSRAASNTISVMLNWYEHTP